MKSLRFLMVGIGVITLFFPIVGISIKDMPAIIFLLIATNTALAIYYAKKTDRSVVGWAIGAFFTYGICSIILALLPVKKAAEMKGLEQTPASSETVMHTGTNVKPTAMESSETIAYEFIASESWMPSPNFVKLHESLKRFSAQEQYQAWYDVGMTFRSRGNHAFGRRCFVEALYHDPNPTAMAWVWIDRALQENFDENAPKTFETVCALRQKLGPLY